MSNSEFEINKLEECVNKIIDTFKFQGITVANMELSKEGIPSFYVQVSRKSRYRSLDETLTFAYWTLWSLLYGEYSEDKSHLKISLNYEEVE